MRLLLFCANKQPKSGYDIQYIRDQDHSSRNLPAVQ